nr:hypothetical protein Hi04_10k_c5218_00005 [uncultured bacterium]
MNDLNRSRNLGVPLRARCFFAVVMLGVLLARSAPAQTLQTLHSFTAGSLFSIQGPITNSDGASPHAGLILSGNTLYGTASAGGEGGAGTLFAVHADGTGFTNLHNFTALPPCGTVGPCLHINSDGASPYGELILWSNTLYGTAPAGGSSGNGTVFALNTDGTGFTNLHSFTALDGYGTNGDGKSPYGALLAWGDTLYGAASQGGSGTAGFGGGSGEGTLFKLNTDGVGFTNLHSFAPASFDPTLPRFTNSDGASPYGGLILSGNTLYGAASQGGSWGAGAIFALNTDGSGFRNLHIFTGGGDGGSPQEGLVLLGNTLYGTAGGGSSGAGTVFALNTDGTGFTNLYNFTALSNSGTNSDGANPEAALILRGNTLYGTAYNGGSSGHGTVFAVNTDGTGFTTLYSFTAATTNLSGAPTNSDGVNPSSGLILSSNTLYGTTPAGGSSGNGTVFSLSFKPQLTITPSGTNIILSWPTNFAGFDYTGYTLQSTTNLVSPLWNTNLQPPVVVNAQLTLTNPISGKRQFFRLSQ